MAGLNESGATNCLSLGFPSS